MYDTLLFLHVLAAFMLAAAAVVRSAFALGVRAAPALARLGGVLWDVGGIGTLVLGIWLAIYVDGYELWDLWIAVAIVLWAAAAETGRRARRIIAPAAGGGATGRDAGLAAERVATATLMHWLSVGLLFALLADMIFKPGA